MTSLVAGEQELRSLASPYGPSAAIIPRYRAAGRIQAGAHLFASVTYARVGLMRLSVGIGGRACRNAASIIADAAEAAAPAFTRARGDNTGHFMAGQAPEGTVGRFPARPYARHSRIS